MRYWGVGMCFIILLKIRVTSLKIPINVAMGFSLPLLRSVGFGTSCPQEIKSFASLDEFKTNDKSFIPTLILYHSSIIHCKLYT